MPQSTEERFLVTLKVNASEIGFKAKAIIYRATLRDVLEPGEMFETNICESQSKDAACSYALTELAVAFNQGRIKL